MITLLKKRPLMFLFIILAIGSFLRFYGLNWDQGHHLHPDERAIVMFTTPLSLPNSIDEFLSPASPINPHFFAYGSFPLYLLKIAGLIATDFDPAFALYDKINLVGRFLSAVFDIGTLFLVFLLGKKLFSKSVGLIAAFFYSISVFPIQTSHFYAVDIMLTFFIVLTLFQLIRFYERPSIKNSILVGVCFGAALATKTSATPLVVAIVLAIAVDFILLVIKQPHKPHIWFPHVPRFLKRLIFDGVTITIATIITFVTLQPYTIIDFQEFLRQTQQVSQVTHNAFAFPFTLQYVGKTPYLYELKNIFLWGQGPILATISFLGTIYIGFLLFRTTPPRSRFATPRRWPEGLLRGGLLRRQTLILLAFFATYFLIVGKFAVGFMRYLLPLYPLFSLFAAVFLHRLLSFRAKPRSSGRSRGISYNHLWSIRSPHVLRLVGMTLIISLVLLWPLAFMYIYTKPNTRVLASDWINRSIPAGSTLATEHWDDGLPLFGGEKYRIISLPLYEQDTPQKWKMINENLSQTDYIIIASNRLYVPLMKLTNCQKLPQGKCYYNTVLYYSELFNESLGFKKVAEFSVYPTLEIGNWKLEIDDSSADESFTVYDHPKVMIFKKE